MAIVLDFSGSLERWLDILLNMANYILKLAKHFPQVKDVFGIKIYASSAVDPVKVEHAALITLMPR